MTIRNDSNKQPQYGSSIDPRSENRTAGKSMRDEKKSDSTKKVGQKKDQYGRNFK